MEVTLPQKILTIDLGTFPAKESVVRKFRVVNSTPHTLTPDSVKASCGCVVADLPVAPIPPNESATYDVTLRADAGGFMKTLDVSFRELSVPVVFHLTGKAKNRFSIAPNEIHLSAKKLEIALEVTSGFEESLKDASCRSLGDLVKVDAKESRIDGLSLIISPVDCDDKFWRRANLSLDTFELKFPDGRVSLVTVGVNSAVDASVFPRIVSLSKQSKTKVIIFRRDAEASPKFIRFVFDGKSIAKGVLSSHSKGSSLSRFALQSVQSMEQTASVKEAVVEESEDQIEWREIGFVSVVVE